MDDITHNDKSAAKAACEQYVAAIHDLQSKLGVWEENEHWGGATWAYARYRDESGKVVNYCHG